MEQNSSIPLPKDTGKNLALLQQYTDLEKQWESLKESNSKQRSSTSTSIIPRRCSTGSNSALTSLEHLLVVESSPRELMSSLQHRRSPSDGFLNTMNWDSSVEEILRDRRAAIRSGKVKGRRLFGAEEGGSDELMLDYEDGGCCESEVCNPGCRSVRNRERSQEWGVSDDKLPDSLVEKRSEGRKAGGGRMFKVAMAWCALVIILVTLGLVVISCNGNAHEFEVFLVPT